MNNPNTYDLANVLIRNYTKENFAEDKKGLLKLNDVRITLIDFGGVKPIGETPAAEYRNLTPSYAGTEQFLRLNTSEKLDLFAIGVLLFEISTGHLPFDNINDDDALGILKNLNQTINIKFYVESLTLREIVIGPIPLPMLNKCNRYFILTALNNLQ